MRGKYPNRGYPKIFKDKAVGEEAQKLYDNAQKMLNQIIEKGWIQANGIIGFYPANSVNHEDIQIYSDDDKRETPLKTFFTLRQQEDRDQESF